MSLIEVVKITGGINRVPRGETPKITLPLDDDERVISADLQESSQTLFNSERKTSDWRWTLYIERRLP